MKMKVYKTYLDNGIIRKFREEINSSQIFNNLDKHKNRYNLMCAVMERIDSAVDYLNRHAFYPKSEEDFIFFLVYACILKDGIYKLYENIFQRRPILSEEKKYFTNASNYFDYIFNEDTCPSDDIFFEYLRSITFAHPFDTGYRNRQFLESYEKQASPWVIVDPIVSKFKKDDAVGVRLYSNIDKRDTYDIHISFKALKAYIKARYLCLIELTKWAQNEIFEQSKKWESIKVIRSEDPFETIKSIKEILKSRFESTYLINVAEKYLCCKLSCQSNCENVTKFRNVIISILPQICDCVDNQDYDGLDSALSILDVTPKNMHKYAYYQLEKIFSYLDKRSDNIESGSNEEWGLIQTYAFSQQFAKKWVYIDIDTMDYDEIHLLVSTACYLEKIEQESIEETILISKN